MLGYVDEVWWSRYAQPSSLSTWSQEGEQQRLVQHPPDKDDAEPKALACYGLLQSDTGQMLLRFVEGRPVSQVTTEFLGWVCARLAEEGKRALLLVWDNASWHISNQVRTWLREHNRAAKRQQQNGVRIVVCQLPSKSPWLNPIEPRWAHGKRAVAEPTRKLSAAELKQRICDYYGCKLLDPITQQLP